MAKNYHNPFLETARLEKGESHMRKSGRILLGSIAVLAVLSAPVLAKSPGAQKADDKSAASACTAYEQEPDGSWTPLPCQEIGSGGQRRKGATTRSDGDSNH
jgi:hypothetical protein